MGKLVLHTFRFLPLGFLTSLSLGKAFVNLPTEAVEVLATDRARLICSLEGFSAGFKSVAGTAKRTLLIILKMSFPFLPLLPRLIKARVLTFLTFHVSGDSVAVELSDTLGLSCHKVFISFAQKQLE